MFDKRLVRHTVTMHIHINVSSQSRFLVWKRNCGYYVCEGGTAERQVAEYFLRGSGTTDLPSIIPCAEAEFQTLKSHNILCAKKELKSRSPILVRRRNCSTAELKTENIPCAETKLRNSKSQHIPYVEAELWNFKSQNIPCVEAELQDTDYSRCGMSLVPYAVVRKTRERRTAGPWVKAILVVLLLSGGGTFWDFFFCYYQAVTNQLTYDRDPGIRQTAWPNAAGTKLPIASIRRVEGEFLTL